MEESLLRTVGLTKRNQFWLPCQKQFNKSTNKVDCKTKEMSWRFLMENDFQNSLVDAQVASIATLLKKIAVIRETNCSEPKKLGKWSFFNRAVYSNICLHWYKAIKKNPDRNINQTLRAIFTHCPRKFQEMRIFLRKKLFTRKSSGNSDCSFEKCVGKVRPEVQQKSHSKPEINWKFLTFKNRSWPIKTNLCTEKRYFSNSRQRISSRQ